MPTVMLDRMETVPQLPNVIHQDNLHRLFSSPPTRPHRTTTAASKPKPTPHDNDTPATTPDDDFSLDKVLQLLFSPEKPRNRTKQVPGETKQTAVGGTPAETAAPSTKRTPAVITPVATSTPAPSSGQRSKPTKRTENGGGEYSSHPNSVEPVVRGGVGLLKLAGCNIYGRMYRVGRIISELSGPCLECKCTEIGVQCKPLGC